MEACGLPVWPPRPVHRDMCLYIHIYMHTSLSNRVTRKCDKGTWEVRISVIQSAIYLEAVALKGHDQASLLNIM